MGKLFENFDKVSIRAVGPEEKVSIDPRMYSGSGGVLFAMYKFTLLGLCKDDKDPVSKYIEKRLSDGIASNINLMINPDKNRWRPPENCASFLFSEMIGISTLSVIWLLTDPSYKVPPLDKVYDIIQNHIVSAIDRCSKENDIVNGASGYLYSLLLIEKKMDHVGEEIV